MKSNDVAECEGECMGHSEYRGHGECGGHGEWHGGRNQKNSQYSIQSRAKAFIWGVGGEESKKKKTFLQPNILSISY